MANQNQLLTYLQNAGSSATIAHFVKDWAPSGQLAWADLHGKGLAREQKGRIYLTPRGLACLSENSKPTFSPPSAIGS